MTSANLMACRSMRPARQKVQVAEAVPTLPCTLLVAMAETGSIPAASSAGTVISPPPPAIASTNPAASAAAHNSATACGPNSANNPAPPRGGRYRPDWSRRPVRLNAQAHTNRLPTTILGSNLHFKGGKT